MGGLLHTYIIQISPGPHFVVPNVTTNSSKVSIPIVIICNGQLQWTDSEIQICGRRHWAIDQCPPFLSPLLPCSTTPLKCYGFSQFYDFCAKWFRAWIWSVTCVENNNKLISGWDRRTLPWNSYYRPNNAMIVKLYYPYTQLLRNVNRLSHRRVVIFGVPWLFW